MKLVEILARELDTWAPTTKCYTQDPRGRAYPWKGKVNPTFNGEWEAAGSTDIDLSLDARSVQAELASDHSTAIITRADWEAERARIKGETKVKPKANKDGWIRHRGGSCPVEAGTLVDVRFRSGEIAYGQPALMQGDPESCWAKVWTHRGYAGDIMSWRPHNAEQSSDVEMPAAKYFDGPLQWRDRIQEINRQMSDLRSEKAGLVVKLRDEGFALIDEPDF